MLMKILKKLAEGGRYSNKSMAVELEIDESLVEQMVDKLIQMGYIEKEKINSCGEGCGCGSNKGCSCSKSNMIQINIWRVTDKGRLAISK